MAKSMLKTTLAVVCLMLFVTVKVSAQGAVVKNAIKASVGRSVIRAGQAGGNIRPRPIGPRPVPLPPGIRRAAIPVNPPALPDTSRIKKLAKSVRNKKLNPQGVPVCTGYARRANAAMRKCSLHSGQQNAHSVYEWCCVEEMSKMVSVAHNIVSALMLGELLQH